MGTIVIETAKEQIKINEISLYECQFLANGVCLVLDGDEMSKIDNEATKEEIEWI